MAYHEWLPIDPPAGLKKEIVVCVHGLTRNGRDFDVLAAQLSGQEHYRVLSVDVLGRGGSERYEDEKDYNYGAYMAHTREWLSHVIPSDNEGIFWVGTSMGGILGMALAAQKDMQPPILKMVINDVGPFITADSIERLKGYCGHPPLFNSFKDAKSYLMNIYEPFSLCDEEWDFLVRHSIEKSYDGSKFTDLVGVNRMLMSGWVFHRIQNAIRSQDYLPIGKCHIHAMTS